MVTLCYRKTIKFLSKIYRIILCLLLYGDKIKEVKIVHRLGTLKKISYYL